MTSGGEESGRRSPWHQGPRILVEAEVEAEEEFCGKKERKEKNVQRLNFTK